MDMQCCLCQCSVRAAAQTISLSIAVLLDFRINHGARYVKRHLRGSCVQSSCSSFPTAAMMSSTKTELRHSSWKKDVGVPLASCRAMNWINSGRGTGASPSGP